MLLPPKSYRETTAPSIFRNSISIVVAPLLRQWRNALQVLAYSLAHFLFQSLAKFFAHCLSERAQLGLFFFIVIRIFVIAASSGTRQRVLFLIGVNIIHHSLVLQIARRMRIAQQATHGRCTILVKLVRCRQFFKSFKDIFHEWFTLLPRALWRG